MKRLALLLALASCASSPEDSRVAITPLDETSYATLVHPVVERSCGSTQCHGMLPRGLRVYGSTALRLPNTTGPTSPAEIRATYESILGLEPEKLTEFTQARSPDAAYTLLVLAKPLTLERHRGGIALRKGEAAEQCLFSWLMGQTDATACTR